MPIFKKFTRKCISQPNISQKRTCGIIGSDLVPVNDDIIYFSPSRGFVIESDKKIFSKLSLRSKSDNKISKKGACLSFLLASKNKHGSGSSIPSSTGRSNPSVSGCPVKTYAFSPSRGVLAPAKKSGGKSSKFKLLCGSSKSSNETYTKPKPFPETETKGYVDDDNAIKGLLSTFTSDGSSTYATPIPRYSISTKHIPSLRDLCSPCSTDSPTIPCSPCLSCSPCTPTNPCAPPSVTGSPVPTPPLNQMCSPDCKFLLDTLENITKNKPSRESRESYQLDSSSDKSGICTQKADKSPNITPVTSCYRKKNDNSYSASPNSSQNSTVSGNTTPTLVPSTPPIQTETGCAETITADEYNEIANLAKKNQSKGILCKCTDKTDASTTKSTNKVTFQDKAVFSSKSEDNETSTSSDKIIMYPCRQLKNLSEDVTRICGRQWEEFMKNERLDEEQDPYMNPTKEMDKVTMICAKQQEEMMKHHRHEHAQQEAYHKYVQYQQQEYMRQQQEYMRYQQELSHYYQHHHDCLRKHHEECLRKQYEVCFRQQQDDYKRQQEEMLRKQQEESLQAQAEELYWLQQQEILWEQQKHRLQKLQIELLRSRCNVDDEDLNTRKQNQKLILEQIKEICNPEMCDDCCQVTPTPSYLCIPCCCPNYCQDADCPWMWDCTCPEINGKIYCPCPAGAVEVSCVCRSPSDNFDFDEVYEDCDKAYNYDELQRAIQASCCPQGEKICFHPIQRKTKKNEEPELQSCEHKLAYANNVGVLNPEHDLYPFKKGAQLFKMTVKQTLQTSCVKAVTQFTLATPEVQKKQEMDSSKTQYEEQVEDECECSLMCLYCRCTPCICGYRCYCYCGCNGYYPCTCCCP